MIDQKCEDVDNPVLCPECGHLQKRMWKTVLAATEEDVSDGSLGTMIFWFLLLGGCVALLYFAFIPPLGAAAWGCGSLGCISGVAGLFQGIRANLRANELKRRGPDSPEVLQAIKDSKGRPLTANEAVRGELKKIKKLDDQMALISAQVKQIEDLAESSPLHHDTRATTEIEGVKGCQKYASQGHLISPRTNSSSQ